GASATVETSSPVERAPRGVLTRARRGVALPVLALSLISPACASRTTPHADSRVSFVIGAHNLAGLPITPDTSYRRVLRYFARADQRRSSSFPDGLCRLRFEKNDAGPRSSRSPTAPPPLRSAPSGSWPWWPVHAGTQLTISTSAP